MKQNQKGITLVGLLITVIIIVTIAGVCIYTGRDILEEAKLEQLKTNMLLIQAKCQSVGERINAKELTEADYIGTAITSNETINNYTITIAEGDKWYKLSADNVKSNIGLGNVKVSDWDYLINYTNSEVVYTQGYNNDKYTLTDIIGTDAE